MNPAYSIIFFTVASGAGYGLLFLLGALDAAGLLPADRGFAAAALGLALGLVGFGLVTSALHLGHPERAWRGLTQWRSSWLSREAVAAVATFAPAALFGLGWIGFGRTDGPWAVAGLATAALALATVGCTAMIYACLRTVRSWHNGWVLPNYLALALLTGAACLAALVRLFGLDLSLALWLVPAAAALAWAVKLGYWRHIDGSAGTSTAGTATGLGPLGEVRLLDGPSTQETYVQREMGYRIGRKHAARLRRIAVVAGFALPLGLGLVGAMLGPGWPATLGAGLVVGLVGLGALIERWLFFAEAHHVVMLYYGAAEV